MDTVAMLTAAKRLVIKIGSALLIDAGRGQLRRTWLSELASDVADLRSKNTDVLIVSSGAIALGKSILGLERRKLSLEQSQASAAVGQIKLARAYEEVLEPFGIQTAQVLLTLDDNENRRRYLNSRGTLSTLLSQGVVPIVNENDTVATDEIRFGDNDRLAAQVAVMVAADVLVLLSDVDGFYDKDPNANPDARRFETISAITPQIESMAGNPSSSLSQGGMKTKLMAARTATNAGCAMAISSGVRNRPIRNLIDGAHCTWFMPVGDPQTARKHWIASMKPKGRVHIDDGAANALRSGKSLLPAGVIRVSGKFGRGEAVEIIGQSGEKLGHGLVRYTRDECVLIKGHRSQDIERILGSPSRSAMIHRDDMSR